MNTLLLWLILIVVIALLGFHNISQAGKPPTWDTYSDPAHAHKDNNLTAGEPLYLFGEGYIPGQVYTIILSNDNGNSFFYKTWKPAKAVGELAEEVLVLPAGHWLSIVYIGTDTWFPSQKVAQHRFQVK